MRNDAQKAQKTMFFAFFFSIFVQSVSKNVKKTLFEKHRAKSSKNAVFFAFFANFVQSVSKNVKKKHCFLTLFEKHRAKSSKKRCLFRIFRELCTKCLEKREKHCFHTLSAELTAKSSKKRCLFTFFAIFVQSFSKKVKKKTQFSHTFCGTSLKTCQKNAVFSNFVQSVSKIEKNTVFLTFFLERREKARKNAVCSHFLQSLYKVSRKKVKKHCFLTLFEERR